MVLKNTPWKYVWSYSTNRWQKTKIDNSLKYLDRNYKRSTTRISTRTYSFQHLQTNISPWKNETYVAIPMIQIDYSYDQNLDQLINRLERECFLWIGWFARNYMKFLEQNLVGYLVPVIWNSLIWLEVMLKEIETRFLLQELEILYLLFWDLYTVHLYAFTGTIKVF